MNKEGKKEYQRQYYIENKERILEYSRQYRKENIEKVRESYRKWFKNNPNKAKELHKHYRDNNPNYITKVKERTKRFRENNPDYYRQYYKNNIEKIRKGNQLLKNKKYKISPRFNINDRMKRAINISLKGNKNGRGWEKLVGYTLDDLVKRLKNTIPEGYIWQDYLEGKLHIDHIIPKSVFNYSTSEHIDFKRCWALENLQLLPARENIIKSNKILKPFQPILKIF